MFSGSTLPEMAEWGARAEESSDRWGSAVSVRADASVRLPSRL